MRAEEVPARACELVGKARDRSLRERTIAGQEAVDALLVERVEDDVARRCTAGAAPRRDRRLESRRRFDE
jgi:hypothetical protein